MRFVEYKRNVGSNITYASCKTTAEVDLITLANLEDGTKFFIEESLNDRGSFIRAYAIKHYVHAASTGKHHFH